VSVPVSIVIPAFNSAKLIGATLETVLAQSEPPVEIIVVDDGSTDHTVDVVARYERVRILRQTNGGPSKARNVGIQAACGDYIAFLDSDDLWVANKLSTQMTAIKFYKNAGFCFSTIWMMLENTHDETPLGPYYPPELVSWLHEKESNRGAVCGWAYNLLLQANCVDTSSMVARKDLLLKVGMFDESLTYGEDHDLWLRLARTCPGIFIVNPMSRYRLHTSALCGGASSGRQDLFYRSSIHILSKHASAYPSLEARKALARVYLEYAIFNLKKGLRNEARELASKGLTKFPTVNGLGVFLEAAFPRTHAAAKRIANSEKVR